MKNQIVVLVIVALLGTVLSQKTLTVTCTSCGVSSCSSGFCYSLQGTSFNETVCVPQGKTCTVGMNKTLSVNNCTTDYSSTTCSPGTCFYLTGTPIALLGATCTTPYTQQTTCGTCASASNCGSKPCQGITKSPNTIPAIGCVDECSSPANSSISVSSCAGGMDALGVTATCCQTFSGNNPGAVCITQNTYFGSSNLLKYYVKGTNF